MSSVTPTTRAIQQHLQAFNLKYMDSHQYISSYLVPMRHAMSGMLQWMGIWGGVTHKGGQNVPPDGFHWSVEVIPIRVTAPPMHHKAC